MDIIKVKNKNAAKKARTKYKQAKKSPVGTGKRFAAVEAAAKASGASNPAAVAASIGQKKYGKKKMAKMAAKGKKRGR